MTIDKAKLKALAEAASKEPKWYHAESFGLSRVTDTDTRSFISLSGPATILELLAEADQLKAENEALRKDLESHKRMLLAAACDVGAIGQALGADEDDDGSEIEGLAMEVRKDAERYRWTSTEGNWVARFHGKWRAHVGGYGDAQPTDWYPSREEAIDAAMSKEAGHD